MLKSHDDDECMMRRLLILICLKHINTCASAFTCSERKRIHNDTNTTKHD